MRVVIIYREKYPCRIQTRTLFWNFPAFELLSYTTIIYEIYKFFVFFRNMSPFLLIYCIQNRVNFLKNFEKLSSQINLKILRTYSTILCACSGSD